MSWRKEERRGERGYHHGNLKEALLQAALGLIAEKGAAGLHLRRCRPDGRRQPAAPYRHFRDRDELLSSIAQRGFEQFESALTQAWDDGRPDTVTAFERVGKAYLAFARNEPAFYSAMFESGLPADLNPALQAASERGFGIIRAAAERLAALGAARHAAPAGDDDGAAYLVDVAWRGLLVRARRRGAAQAADVSGGSSRSGSADLSARSRLPDRPPAVGPKLKPPLKNPPAHRRCRRQARPQVPGAPQNKLAGAGGSRLDKKPGWFRYVNVIYIHNGLKPSWRGKWPTPQTSIAGAVPLKSPTNARTC